MICVSTVIKNEHLYLDDFIKYHTSIGVDHIFVFEDVDSYTHKDITQKYENVSLLSVSDLFEEKLDKKPGQIEVYTKYLEYVNSFKKFDWCFAIDIDEYVTLEKKDATLVEVLGLYDKYDVIILDWENYGANGIVKTPDYSNRSITEIFTQKVGIMPNDDMFTTSKLCYNMRTFDKKFIFTHHIPSGEAKWCWTDFNETMNVPPYTNIKNIYIRHYITKSWEEYVWKLKIRGDYINHRNYDDFFYLNKDLESIKDKLMKIT
jgi:hypothetical protein